MQPVTKSGDKVCAHICNKYGQTEYQSNKEIFLFCFSLIMQGSLSCSKHLFFVICGDFCGMKAFFINGCDHISHCSRVCGFKLNIGLCSRQVDGSKFHTRQFCERSLNMAHTGCTIHALHRKLNGIRCLVSMLTSKKFSIFYIMNLTLGLRSMIFKKSVAFRVKRTERRESA